LRFAEEGAKVLAVDNDLASAEETVVARQSGRKSVAFAADVTKEATLAAMVEFAQRRWARTAHLDVPLPGVSAPHAVISNQARFRREQVTFAGEAKTWTRTAESGSALTFHFCPTCGSTVYWEGEGFPGYVAIAIGNFPEFSRADHRGMGGVTPPLGYLAARHAAQAGSEAGVIRQPAVWSGQSEEHPRKAITSRLR
jgi:hypothetical protein